MFLLTVFENSRISIIPSYYFRKLSIKVKNRAFNRYKDRDKIIVSYCYTNGNNVNRLYNYS